MINFKVNRIMYTVCLNCGNTVPSSSLKGVKICHVSFFQRIRCRFNQAVLMIRVVKERLLNDKK